MESPLGLATVPWDPEPFAIPLNRPPGTFSPTGGEGRDEGVRFTGKGSGVNEGQPMSRPRSYFKTLAWTLLALVFLYPMLWMTLSSFKSSNVEIFGHPF